MRWPRRRHDHGPPVHRGAGDCLLAGLLHVLAAGGSGREALVSGVHVGRGSRETSG
jgi:sugar/nucleoside kinase (ribokinase family)